MTRPTHIRNSSWLLRAMSLLTLVALRVGASWARLCASRNWGRADASAATNGNCHGAGGLHHEAPLVQGIRNCNLPELTAIVSASTPPGRASGMSRLGASSGIFLAVEQGNPAPAATLSEFWFCRPDRKSTRLNSSHT